MKFMSSILVVLAAGPLYGQQNVHASHGTVQKSNIVFILADDLGWGELNCFGNTFNETPHLNKLAAQGIKFTNAYAAGPVCSPTRASIMTGQYPARVGITDFLAPSTGRLLDPAKHVTV
ncbi:MAG TPA: sulfatase-like hydrolase/transferase, partial [Chryseosolibacter sp.]|nr:sulfatase-like hydrolase/transferase [Chryseosolibacter sp.]